MKSLKCLSNFINRDYSAKPWNRYSHFSEFIKPKENHSLCLKDHRFNRLNDGALSVLYHMDDISGYLDRYDNIINGLSILDHSFLEMEVLKPMYAAIALVGIHTHNKTLSSPCLGKNSKYSTLMNAFPTLYEELVTITPDKLLRVEHNFKFASHEYFINALPKDDLLNVLCDVVHQYPQEFQQLLSLLFFSETSHGGTGFFVKNSLAYNIRNDLKLVQPSSGEFESTFLEIVLPGKKNLIIGCIYRHPSSNLTVDQFNNDYIEPLLQNYKYLLCYWYFS